MPFYIDKSLSRQVLMAGNYYKNHHPGGISAVVDYWSRYIDGLQYYPTFKEGNVCVKLFWFVFSYIRMFFRMIFDRQIKIVHLHAAADGSFWRKVQILKMAKFLNRKVVLHIHASRFKDFYNEASEKKKKWIVDNLKKADVLVCLAESWRKWFESVGVESSKIVVLHNITSFPEFKDDESKKESDRPVRFLFMGEIGQRKGVFDLLKVISSCKDDLNGKLLLKIGGNKNEAQLLKVIEDEKLQNLVNFEGWVSGDKKIDLLNWCDVYILPSYNEGLPISILEAMSYSHPIISTNVGGIPEVLVSDVNGVLITPGNEKQIHDALFKYINNPDSIIKEGLESKGRASTYLPDFVLSHLKEIYTGLI